MEDVATRLFCRLDRLEECLREIEGNGRPDDHQTRPVNRDDIDGLQMEVNIRCNLIQMGDIDNVAQEFKASMYISADYLEPNLKGVRSDEGIDWTKQWDPRIVFINATNVESLIKKVSIIDYDNEKDMPWVRKSYRLSATFKEKLELQNFPFDYQELNVTLMSDWPARHICFKKDMKIKDSIAITNFTASQTWELQPYILGGPLDIKEESGSHRKYPRYQLTVHVKRYMGYYFWNIAIVTLMIMMLTFASFSVPPTETGDRLSVSVTLLLTSVAFKFVVSQNLPTISYLTQLDIYVLMCMAFQVLITVQNSLSSLYSDPGQAQQAKLFDTISALVLVGLIVIFHIVYGIMFLVKLRKRNSTIREVKRSYNALCAEINEDFQRRKRKNQINPEPQKVNNNEELGGAQRHLPPNRLEPIQAAGSDRKTRKKRRKHSESSNEDFSYMEMNR